MSTKSQPRSDAKSQARTSGEPLVLTQRLEAVAVCTLNRPQTLNALSSELIAQLLKHLESLDRNPEVRVIIITGGPQVFAAGADIKEMAHATAAHMARKDFLKPWDRFAKISKPIIAAVNGYAVGGGCELAMACDLIVASEDALFGQPEILLGVMPGAGGTQRLPRAIGKSRALELLWTGRRLDSRRALEWGLINAVVPGPVVLEEAIRVAREIAAQPQAAVREIKVAVYEGLQLDLMEALKLERRRFYTLFDTADQKEGMAAFMEKRKPNFESSVRKRNGHGGTTASRS